MNSSGKRISQGDEGSDAPKKKIHVMEEEEEHVLSCLKDVTNDHNNCTDKDTDWITKFPERNDQNNCMVGEKTETKAPPACSGLERKLPPGWVNKTIIIPRGNDGGVSCFISQTEYVRDESKELFLSKEEKRKFLEQLIRAQEKSFETHGIVPGPGVRPVFSMDMLGS